MHPGSQNNYPIQLLDNEIDELRHLIEARKTSQATAMRAKVILLAHEQPDWSNQQIGQEAGCSDCTV